MTNTWSVVCTTNASPKNIDLFLGHYLTLGATRVFLYLDSPVSGMPPSLFDHKKVEVMLCDGAYWDAEGIKRPDTHVQRQIHNATRSYYRTHTDWIGHFDIDEFVLTATPPSVSLNAVPDEILALKLEPVERLADHPKTSLTGCTYFKRAVPWAARNGRRLEKIYPNYGRRLKTGLLSHSQGKVFARTGIQDAKLGIHRLKSPSMKIKYRRIGLTFVGHFHCPSVDEFLDKLKFRMAAGSYRRQSENAEKPLNELLNEILDTQGDSGISDFYSEVCCASPRLLRRLAKRDLLVITRFNLQAHLHRAQKDIEVDISLGGRSQLG
ncbi:glycosyltransferase family 2 protein [Roseivivax sp. CAU 1753]